MPVVDGEGFSSENIWACAIDSELVRSKTVDSKGLVKVVHHGDNEYHRNQLEKLKEEFEGISAEPIEKESRERSAIYELKSA